MAAAKKRGLGRGLDALIGGDLPKEEAKESARNVINSVLEGPEEDRDLSGVQQMDINLLSPDRAQPRKNFDETALGELAESIKQYGIIQPLLVQKKEDYYQIIAGERRFRAAMKAGLKQVPVLIKDYNEQETLEISLIENIQRENLDPIEEAEAYRRLADEYNLKQSDIADRVGKSRSAVANSLRLLSLDASLRTMVAEGTLSFGHAKVLLGVEKEALRLALAKKCAEDGWSVRQLEKAVELASKAPAEKKETKTTAEAYAFEAAAGEMQAILGTKVQILPGKKKGRIEIEYYSEDELERLLAMLRSVR